jgi:hypothetical protein
VFGDKPVTAKDLVNRSVFATDGLKEAVEEICDIEGKGVSSSKLSYKLRSLRDRNVAGFVLRAGPRSDNATRWRLIRVSGDVVKTGDAGHTGHDSNRGGEALLITGILGAPEREGVGLETCPVSPACPVGGIFSNLVPSPAYGGRP